MRKKICGGQRVRNEKSLFIIVTILAISIVLFPSLSAYPNGHENDNQQYDCGGSGSCHTVISTAMITMWTSDSFLDPAQSITVTVNITGGEASNSPLGVMIVSSTSTTGSLPSENGWTITSDPSGVTSFNYYEIDAYTGDLSLEWTLTAPSDSGVYTLYAREFHGNGEAYGKDIAQPLSFSVGDGIGVRPIAMITSPGMNAVTAGTITINSYIISEKDIAYVILKIDGTQVDNRTAWPYSWTIDTEDYADGEHSINITAVDNEGYAGYDEITITIDNAGERRDMLNWIVTMLVSVVLIISIGGIAVVIALLIRKRVMEGGRK